MAEDDANLCPKCKYDLRGLAASDVCPECGIHVESERRRLGSRKSVFWFLVPMTIGSLVWTMVMPMPFSLAAQYPFDPFNKPATWVIATALVLHWGALLSCLVMLRQIRAAPADAHSRLTVFAWSLFFLSFILVFTSYFM